MNYPRTETVLREWEQASAGDPKLTMMQHAHLMNIPYEIYRARMDTARRAREIKGKIEYSLGQPLKLSGDWMIVGDVHSPFTDYDFATLVSMVARKQLPKSARRLLVAGDFFNMDVFSRYPHLVNAPTWAQEREAAKGLIDEWLNTFSEIVFLMGNHDRRLQKFVAGAFDETDIFALVKANPSLVKASNFGWCTIDTPGGIYRVTHPMNYSINQLGVADVLAQKYGQHVISFHEHHLSAGYDRYKRYVVINGGCLVDPGKLAYVSLDDSKSAGMAAGFVMLRNGAPYVFGKAPFTDWDRWI